MSRHTAAIRWRHAPSELAPDTYTRNHVATLNGGQRLDVSASPEYLGDPACADPEQLLVSSLASCHMLFFLALAEMQGFRVESYRDDPEGFLERGASGSMAVTRITLSPRVTFMGEKRPDAEALAKLHDSAHRRCFIANSLTAEVTVAPVAPAEAAAS